MPELAQAGNDLRSTRNRNVAFFARAAEQHRDFQRAALLKDTGAQSLGHYALIEPTDALA
jgi:hypothetical protein